MGINKNTVKVIKETLDNVASYQELGQHYALREGFVFTKGHRDRIFDEIVVRSPSNANCYSPIFPIADKTIDDYINVINGARLEDALVFAKDLSFLTKCPSLKYVSIKPSDDIDGVLDVSPLYSIKNIKSLSVDMTYGEYPDIKKLKNEIDYSKIKGLICLGIKFDCNNHKNYDKIETLKTLWISQYSKKDLKELFTSKILDSLFIITSRITTLDGISVSDAMQCIHLCYNRSLRDINALKTVKSTLKVLIIDSCPKIADFSVLKELNNLEVLVLKGSNKLSDLQFLRTLNNLKIFDFNMEIEDGDLTPCLSIPYVFCEKSRKKYNLKNEDLPSNKVDLKNTGMENVEYWRRIIDRII